MEQKSETEKTLRRRSLIIWLASLLVFSGVIVYLLRFVEGLFETSLAAFTHYAYGVIFLVALLSAATIIFPIPATALVAAAAAKWDPIVVALVAGTGAALGELVGYYAGVLGGKVILKRRRGGFERAMSLMNKYGVWAVALVALFPIVLFDVIGLVAGALRLPVWKFLPACWLGRIGRALFEAYVGFGFLRFVLPW